MKKNLSFGDTVDARCSVCKKVTSHVVLAMVDILPLGVECLICKKIQRYSAPSVVRQKTKLANVVPTIKQEDWDTLRAAMNSISVQEYNMDIAYRVGSIIKHPSFGPGLVQRLAGNRKMEILFEEGKKMLRCK